jgi:hypothetical protein
MKRARLANVVVAAGLGLTAGCSGLSNFSLFHRNGDACCTDGIPLDATAGAPGGPMMGDFGPGPMPPMMAAPPPPAATPLLPAPVPAPNGAAPAPAPLPRLVPQPEQARPMPYTP